MKMVDVKNKAKKMGMKPGKLRKEELILAIQRAEGNNPCYKSEGAESCPQTDCCWRDDCF